MVQQNKASGTDYELISHADMRRWYKVRRGLSTLSYGSIGMGVGLLVVGGMVMLGALILIFGRIDAWAAMGFHPEQLFRSPLIYVVAACALLILGSAGSIVVGLALCAAAPSRNRASALAVLAMVLMTATVPAAAFALSVDVEAVMLFPLFLLVVFVFQLLFIRQILTYLYRDRFARQTLSLLAFGTAIVLAGTITAMFSEAYFVLAFVLAGPVGLLAVAVWWLWLLRRTRRALDADMADWQTEAPGHPVNTIAPVRPSGLRSLRRRRPLPGARSSPAGAGRGA